VARHVILVSSNISEFIASVHNIIYRFLQDISMAGSSISCNILEGWKILGIVVGVYIIVMSADIAYKHANC
jgi:hypothetical protein